MTRRLGVLQNDSSEHSECIDGQKVCQNFVAVISWPYLHHSAEGDRFARCPGGRRAAHAARRAAPGERQAALDPHHGAPQRRLHGRVRRRDPTAECSHSLFFFNPRGRGSGLIACPNLGKSVLGCIEVSMYHLNLTKSSLRQRGHFAAVSFRSTRYALLFIFSHGILTSTLRQI